MREKLKFGVEILSEENGEIKSEVNFDAVDLIPQPDATVSLRIQLPEVGGFEQLNIVALCSQRGC